MDAGGRPASTQTWRSTAERRYFMTLAAWGYPLSDLETRIVAEHL